MHQGSDFLSGSVTFGEPNFSMKPFSLEMLEPHLKKSSKAFQGPTSKDVFFFVFVLVA